MADGITQVRLDDGTVVWARVTEAQELRAGLPKGAYEDSSAARRVAGMAGGLADVARGVVGSLRMGLAAARPHEVKVEFGIELSAQAGQVISLIADGSGKASITVSLTWTERGDEPGADPGAGRRNEPGPESGADPGAGRRNEPGADLGAGRGNGRREERGDGRGSAPGPDPGPERGYAPGAAPGYAPGPEPGYAPGPAPGYAPGAAPRTGRGNERRGERGDGGGAP
ncbi:CU044_2847 family protein [Streptomyces sp. NPDC026206]|uniref:CU044_2847 family protein n=1 Tax=Streptomyces sp. NPDC026206 TaxID=3157089 RepID=UPI0033C07AAC